MGFLAINSLFHKDSVSDYNNVLVPLEKAQRHSSVEVEYARRRSAKGNGSTKDDSGQKKEAGALNGSESCGEDGVMRITSADYKPYTIEGLRAEVMEDVATSGYNSAYNCKLFSSPKCPGG
jgi:hypothetical protein